MKYKIGQMDKGLNKLVGGLKSLKSWTIKKVI